jgi:membrane-associated phospholipid phosphatase
VGFSDKGDRYGMPSGHTALAFAFFPYALIWLIRRKQEAHRWKRALGYAVSVPLFVVAPLLVAFQRIHGKHHSVAQVAVGAMVGAGLAVVASLPLE